eukprot:COSAG02_NODE_732_length_17973_cov_6.920275_11_plen_96_part_00
MAAAAAGGGTKREPGHLEGSELWKALIACAAPTVPSTHKMCPACGMRTLQYGAPHVHVSYARRRCAPLRAAIQPGAGLTPSVCFGRPQRLGGKLP